MLRLDRFGPTLALTLALSSCTAGPREIVPAATTSTEVSGPLHGLLPVVTSSDLFTPRFGVAGAEWCRRERFNFFD